MGRVLNLLAEAELRLEQLGGWPLLNGSPILCNATDGCSIAGRQCCCHVGSHATVGRHRAVFLHALAAGVIHGCLS